MHMDASAIEWSGPSEVDGGECVDGGFSVVLANMGAILVGAALAAKGLSR